jgi:hypothetical protein
VAAAVQIRTTRVALLAVLFGAICLSPVALAQPWLPWLYAVPLIAAVRVLRAGVDVDGAGMTVRALLGARRVPWERVAGLRVRPRGAVDLVLRGGATLRLPAVRARHLPLIAAASRGHLPDPTADRADGAPADGAPADTERADGERAETERAEAGPAGGERAEAPGQ